MKRLIVFFVAVLCLCGCTRNVNECNVLVVEKVWHYVDDTYFYYVKGIMNDNTYKLGKIRIEGPRGLYEAGDTIYFTKIKVEE